jgi:hypothetical protein
MTTRTTKLANQQLPPLILSSHPFAFGCMFLSPWAVFGFLDCLEVDADHALSRGRGLMKRAGPPAG